MSTAKDTLSERLAEFNSRVAASAHQLFPDIIQAPAVECRALFGSIINYNIRLSFPEDYLEETKKIESFDE